MNQEVLEVLSTRDTHGIDPHIHIWGWEVPGYLFLGGVVAGIMLLVALLEISSKKKPRSLATQLMPFAGIVLLSLGMFFLFLDLAYKTHVLRFYATFEPTSAMSWGSWILILVYPVMALMGLGGLGDEQRDWVTKKSGPLASVMKVAFALSDKYRASLLWLSVVGGTGLGVYTGLLLGTMAARPVWSTSVLGPLFLVSGISTGAAFMMLFKLDEHEAHTLVRWDSMAIVIELVLITALVIGFLTGDAAHAASGHYILGGEYTAPFWGLVVVMGLLVPLGLNLVEIKKNIPGTRYAPFLILAGGLALRAVIVAAGQLSNYSHLAG